MDNSNLMYGSGPQVGQFVYGTQPIIEPNNTDVPTRVWFHTERDLTSWGLGVGVDWMNPKGSGWHVEFWLDLGPLSFILGVGK